jgi:hypothetical protein
MLQRMNVCYFGPLTGNGNLTEANTKIILQQEPPALYTFFCEMLPLERLELNVQFPHFIDNPTVNEYQGPAKIFKIYPTFQHLNKKFQNLYLPNQDIVIDESLTLWKGKSFKQYMPLNAPKFGIKCYKLCESSTGYVWSFIIYTGQGMEVSN